MKIGYNSSLRGFFFCFVFLFFLAQDVHATNTEEEFNPSSLIDHHIMDAHSWEVFHGFMIHLPVIVYSQENGLDVFSSANFYNENHQVIPYKNYVLNHEHITLSDGGFVLDFSITKNVFFSFINAILLILVFFAVVKGYKKNKGKAPLGIQSFFEPIIIFIRDEVVKPNIGPKYEKYMPYMLTLFFFIWFGNLLGLLPGAANMSGNITTALVLAFFTFVITMFSGNKTYWSHLLNPIGNTMGWAGKIPLYLILVPIELIGILTKPFSLMIRLFANITAGHIIILSILSLTFVTKSISVGVLSAVFAAVMNLLELFVAILQAYVFVMLSSLYFGQAVEEHH